MGAGIGVGSGHRLLASHSSHGGEGDNPGAEDVIHNGQLVRSLSPAHLALISAQFVSLLSAGILVMGREDKSREVYAQLSSVMREMRDEGTQRLFLQKCDAALLRFKNSPLSEIGITADRIDVREYVIGAFSFALGRLRLDKVLSLASSRLDRGSFTEHAQFMRSACGLLGYSTGIVQVERLARRELSILRSRSRHTFVDLADAGQLDSGQISARLQLISFILHAVFFRSLSLENLNQNLNNFLISPSPEFRGLSALINDILNELSVDDTGFAGHASRTLRAASLGQLIFSADLDYPLYSKLGVQVPLVFVGAMGMGVMAVAMAGASLYDVKHLPVTASGGIPYASAVPSFSAIPSAFPSSSVAITPYPSPSVASSGLPSPSAASTLFPSPSAASTVFPTPSPDIPFNVNGTAFLDCMAYVSPTYVANGTVTLFGNKPLGGVFLGLAGTTLSGCGDPSNPTPPQGDLCFYTTDADTMDLQFVTNSLNPANEYTGIKVGFDSYGQGLQFTVPFPYADCPSAGRALRARVSPAARVGASSTLSLATSLMEHGGTFVDADDSSFSGSSMAVVAVGMIGLFVALRPTFVKSTVGLVGSGALAVGRFVGHCATSFLAWWSSDDRDAGIESGAHV